MADTHTRPASRTAKPSCGSLKRRTTGTRPLPLTSDTRPSAHAFGSLAVPEDVEVELRDACSEANILAAFLRRELRRAAKYGLVEDPSAPKKAPAEESAEPAEGAFLTDGMPPDGELVNVPPPSSPKRCMPPRARRPPRRC